MTAHETSLNRTGWLMVLAFVGMLLSVLFKLPQPSAIASQPWRVELFSCLMILGAAVWIYCSTSAVALDAVFRQKYVVLSVAGLAAFVIWSLISATWALSTGWVLHHTLVWAAYLAIIFIIIAIIQIDNSYRFIFRSFAIVGAILGTLCLIDYFQITDFTTAEGGTFRIRYGKFAEMLIMTTPLLAILPLYLRRKSWILASVASWLLSWAVVMLSLSKGALLAGIAGHVVVFCGCIFFSRRNYRMRGVLLAAVWIAVTLTAQVVPKVMGTASSTVAYSGSVDATRETSLMRIFTWQIAVEMASSSPFLGVGADNFNHAFNAARTSLQAGQPSGGSNFAEDYMVERAHNETLQLFAELGIVGLLLIGIGFISLAVLIFVRFRAGGFIMSPLLWSSIAGMIAFGVSSQVSSFSFRVVQNGIVFFVLFGVAINQLYKMKRGGVSQAHAHFIDPGFVMAGSALTALTLLVFCGYRAAGEYQSYRAERTEDVAVTEQLFKSVVRFDPDNARGFFQLALLYQSENRHDEAADAFRSALNAGLGTSPAYSLLAKNLELASRMNEADSVYSESVSVYPNSVFARVDRALFLKSRDRHDEAAVEMDFAKAIDARQAKGWHALMTTGSTAAYFTARDDARFTLPDDLLPSAAVLQYLDDSPKKLSGMRKARRPVDIGSL